MVDIPKESFVVGYEKKNGNLALYGIRSGIQTYDTYDEALEVSKHLPRDILDAVTEIQVYTMKFEEAEPQSE